jgi:hypothetical protein
VYGSWGSTAVQRGDDWAQTSRVTNRATGATTRVTRTDQGAAVSRNPRGEGGGFVAAGEGGNVYAGRDGNVYQRNSNGEWTDVNRPTQQSGAATRQADPATRDQLNRDHAARTSGTQRTNDYSGVKSSGGGGSGSYRGMSGGRGGGGRGGGGRRR